MLMFEWTLSFPRTGRASGASSKRWNSVAQTQLQNERSAPGRLTVGDVSRVRMRLRFCDALAGRQVDWFEFAALVIRLVNPPVQDSAKPFEGFLMLR